MSATFFALVADYGAAVILVATFASCLGLPLPSSLVMLGGGAFVASGDLTLTSVLASAIAGAVAGDQLGYAVGRWGNAALRRRAESNVRRRALFRKASSFVARWGGGGVFFSRWLLSPLGPYVNVLAGGSEMGWARFTTWQVLGEAVWVGLYVGLGYSFGGRIEFIADVAGNAVGFVTATTVTLALGAALIRRFRRASQAI